MGSLNRFTRFLTSKEEEEVVETPIHPHLQNHYISYGDSSEEEEEEEEEEEVETPIHPHLQNHYISYGDSSEEEEEEEEVETPIYPHLQNHYISYGDSSEEEVETPIHPHLQNHYISFGDSSSSSSSSEEEEEEVETPIHPHLQNHYISYGDSSSSSSEEEEEEEVETPIHPHLQNHYISYGDSSETSPKLWRFYLAKPKKTADPLLPVQNPASIISTEPLLIQTPPISSPTTTFSDEESECDEDEDDNEVDRVLWCEYESYPAGRNFPFLEETFTGMKLTEEEEVKIKSVIVVGEERWIKHYSSRHRILLVGEGDFSFSACLAVAFGSSATNIIATCLNAKTFLKKNYGSAMSNIAELRSRGSKVMYGIDATEIVNHELLRQLKFDRIIFNFPFAGFYRNLSPECQLRCHRRLVSLFLKNAKEMISENGEIHVSHKTNGFHAKFNLESIASSHGLRLIAAVKFKCGNYPGYNTKYGFGGDKNFNCYPSKTFKFGLKT